MTDKIKHIGIRFKEQDKNNKMLTLVPRYERKCHEHAYLIDEESDKVTCRNCDKTFNPMSVLVELARKESRWMINLADYQERMKRLSEKKRTKCRNCGEFTPVREK